MVIIKGLQKTSLIDYPDKIASTVFLANCNFRCPFCQNADLVLHYKNMPEIKEEELLEHLHNKKKWLDGVCISGGEPTLHKDLPEFISKIKNLDLLVKLDTNGSNPEMLKSLIEKKLVDFIAMDLKGPIDDYNKSAGLDVDMSKIKQSIALLMENKVEYEFRTTVVQSLHSKQDIVKIAKYINGAKRYVLQQFKPAKSLINPDMEKEKPYKKPEIESIKKACEKFVNTEIR
ncbi:MAG: anaerobic ribonucleoside-triphosphate reductase activating protein [bacterium]|nr:anaerobic ribonucleoside-triphosphate reductase activating protein [bacterium]